MTTAVTFLRKGFQSFTLSIPDGTTKAEKDRADRLRRLAKGGGFEFTHQPDSGMAHPVCKYTTGDPEAIKFIREVSEKANLGIQEDISMMPIRCPYCDFTTQGNTEFDRTSLARHIIDKHADMLTASSESDSE